MRPRMREESGCSTSTTTIRTRLRKARRTPAQALPRASWLLEWAGVGGLGAGGEPAGLPPEPDQDGHDGGGCCADEDPVDDARCLLQGVTRQVGGPSVDPGPD